MVMKKSLTLLMISVLFSFCSATNKMANKAFYHALVGQNEMTVCSRLGVPTTIIPILDGGKILIYEFYEKGMFLISNSSNLADSPISLFSVNKKTGAIYDIKVDPEAVKSQYTSYQGNVNNLMVFLDREGKCVRFEQYLPREKLEFYYQKLKDYIPKD